MKFLYYTIVVAIFASPLFIYAGLRYGWRKPLIVAGCMAAGYAAAMLVGKLSKKG